MLPPGYIRGLAISNTVGVANSVDVATGVARNLDDTLDIALVAALTKSLDSTFVPGHGGGLDTGTKAPNAWYFGHLIRQLSDDSIDALLSASILNPVVPPGWVHERRLNAFHTDNAGNIQPFLYTPSLNLFEFRCAVVDLSAQPNSVNARSITVPLGKKWRALVTLSAAGPNAGYLGACDPDTMVGNIYRVIGWQPSVGAATAFCEVVTNAAGQIATYSSGAGATLSIFMRGFFDDRDRDA